MQPSEVVSRERPNQDSPAVLPMRLSALCIEDNPDDADLALAALQMAGCTVLWQVAEDEASVSLALKRPVDVVLSDFNLPRFSPHRALALLAERGLDVPLVVVTRAIGEESAVGVLRAGAADYLAKDKLATLPLVVARVLDEAARKRRERQLGLDLQQAHHRLRVLSAGLVSAQEDERKQIARDLHDSLGQLLTAAQLHLHAASRTADSQVAAIFRDKAQSILAQGIEQIKSLSFAMRPPQLDLLGLAAAVRALLEQMTQPAGLEIELDVRGDERSASAVQQAVAYRVLQEAVTNAVRHARARRLRIHLCFASPRMSVTVADDGVGMQPQPPVAGRLPGQGLQGMQERCELVGGRLAVRSTLCRGTVLRARL